MANSIWQTRSQALGLPAIFRDVSIGIVERPNRRLKRGRQVAIQTAIMPTQISTVESTPPGISSPIQTMSALIAE